MSRDTLPLALRGAVEADLRPVRPLARPARRALYLVPIAFLVLVAIYLRGVRFDAGGLGLVVLWGLSAVQVAAGLLLLVAALREAVPGEAVSRRWLVLGLGGLVAWLGGVIWVTWLRSPTLIPAGSEGHYWRLCLSWPVLLALPLVAAALLLARRAYPLRPGLVGALCGLGAGLIADGGWRAYCEVSLPSHVLDAHLLALLATTLVGALAGALLGRRG